MRKSIVIFAAMIAVISAIAVAQGPGRHGAGHCRMMGTLPESMGSEANPITSPKIDLGRMLFYDPRLSKGGNVSCNSCHDLMSYGVDGKPVSTGHNGQKGTRNSPSVYHAAGQIAQFWDGRAADVEEHVPLPQAVGVGRQLLVPAETTDDRQDDARIGRKGRHLAHGPADVDAAMDAGAHQPSTGMVCFAASFERATCMTLTT